MTRKPKAGKRDANHRPLAALWDKAGGKSFDTADLPGQLDMVICLGRITARVEVKNPEQPRHKQKMTPAEQDTWDAWPGLKFIWMHETDVMEAREIMRDIQRSTLP